MATLTKMHGRNIISIPISILNENDRNAIQAKEKCGDCNGEAKVLIVELDGKLAGKGTNGIEVYNATWFYCGICEVGG